MSVENNKIIDALSINPQGIVVLTISDHLEWDENNEHLIILQEKINAYIDVIESGEIFESYPNAQDRKLQIEIVFKYSPNAVAVDFLIRVEEIISMLGFEFNFYTLGNTPYDI